MKINELFQLIKQEAKTDQRELHAIELLEPYLKIRPNHSCAWLIYGECLRVVGRLEEAMSAFFYSLDIAPKEAKPIILGHIGLLCTTSRSPFEAENWYAIAANSKFCEDGWIWLNRGINLRTLGKYEEALSCIQKACKYDDVDRSEGLLNKGLIFRSMARYDDAISAFQHALKIDPEYEAAKNYLKGLEGIKKTDEIIQHIEIKSTREGGQKYNS